MHKSLGFSLYLSTFAAQWDTLGSWAGTGAPIFLSLHISEEFGPGFCARAEDVCHKLADAGFRTIADVSQKTLAQFGCRDLVELASRLRLWALRIDYGFSREEIGAMAEKMPIVLNASTTTVEDAKAIAARGRHLIAMHNFYPRPETGLDRDYLMESTKALQAAGLEVWGFIPGDDRRRGPLYEGLPTLEEHRNWPPSAAFADMALSFGLDGVFLGDPGISAAESERIFRFCREDILSIPAELSDDCSHLYDKVFTCRTDSPKWMVRFQESRVYSCQGQIVAPAGCGPRPRGAITMDNARYGRYSGEIQMLRSGLPADSRVNVIGHVCGSALPLMDLIRRGSKFTLVRP